MTATDGTPILTINVATITICPDTGAWLAKAHAYPVQIKRVGLKVGTVVKAILKSQLAKATAALRHLNGEDLDPLSDLE